MMELLQLSSLGRVGGVAGIAIGAAVVVLIAVLGLTDALPVAWRGPLLLVVVLGVVAFGVLALLGWIRRSRGGGQIAETSGDRSEGRNEDASKDGAHQRATTRGKDSPAVNIRR